MAIGSSVFSMFVNPRAAQAALPANLNILNSNCDIATQGSGKIPFISFDLAGGTNIAGSNVLVGKQGGQLDFLTTEAYSKMGLPDDMIPPLIDPADPYGRGYTDTTLGLAFHKNSGFLRGILEKVSTTTAANINGAVIPAGSNNGTANSSHNPLFEINKANSMARDCQNTKLAELFDRYPGDGDELPPELDPAIDPNIIGPIFTQAEFDGDGDFRQTSSTMKFVMDGFADAGPITMEGYAGDRETGEARDLRAGRCMGACLEYAARVGVPLMLYVFSDGTIDNSVNSRSKGIDRGDNSETSASFFLVYDPAGRPRLRGATTDAQLMSQQIGYFRADGSVETSSSPAANNVNLLVETVVLNYMALQWE